MYCKRKYILLMSSIYLGSAIYLYSILITVRCLNKPLLHSKGAYLTCDAYQESQYFAVLEKFDINVSSLEKRYDNYQPVITSQMESYWNDTRKHFELILTRKVRKNDRKCGKQNNSLIAEYVSDDSINDYHSFTFDDPASYSGYVIDAWPPSKDRNVSNYINEPFSYLPSKSNFLNKTLVIIVQSRPSEIDLRAMWRYFVGKYTNACTSIMFLMGKEVGLDSNDKLLLVEERNKYNDIAMIEGLIEHYHNLTLKSLYSLKLFLNDAWMPDAPKYLLKVDIDVFVNIPKLLQEVVQNVKYQDLGPFLLGKCFGCPSSTVQAQRLSPPPLYNIWSEEMKQHMKNYPAYKWIIPSYLYNKESWPSFETGPAYLLTRNSAECMLQKTSSVPYLPLEDVYVTGFLAQECGVKKLNHPGFTTGSMPFDYERDIINHLDYSNCAYLTGSIKRCSYDRLEDIESIMEAKSKC